MSGLRQIIALSAVALSAITTANAASVPKKYDLTIQIDAPNRTERSEAWVIELGHDYKAEIAYIGAGTLRKGISQSQENKVFGLAGLAESSDPKAVIINGGFSIGGPSSPDGLLLVDGEIFSPFTFYQDPKKVFHLDTVICLTGDKLSLRPITEFVERPETATTLCKSAIQTTPRFLQNGRDSVQNVIPRSELNGVRRKRTIVGFDGKGVAYAVLFTQPINRYLIAEFLKQKPLAPGVPAPGKDPNKKEATITVPNNRPVSVTEGVGLVDAVGLSSDENSVAVVQRKSLTGNMYRQLPSALIFH